MAQRPEDGHRPGRADLEAQAASDAGLPGDLVLLIGLANDAVRGAEQEAVPATSAGRPDERCGPHRHPIHEGLGRAEVGTDSARAARLEIDDRQVPLKRNGFIRANRGALPAGIAPPGALLSDNFTRLFGPAGNVYLLGTGDHHEDIVRTDGHAEPASGTSGVLDPGKLLFIHADRILRAD